MLSFLFLFFVQAASPEDLAKTFYNTMLVPAGLGVEDIARLNLVLTADRKNGSGVLQDHQKPGIPESIVNFYPFNAIGKFYVQFDDNSKIAGHATMISEKVAITAAHLLLSSPNAKGERKRAAKCVFVFHGKEFNVDGGYEYHPEWENFNDAQNTFKYQQYDVAKICFLKPLIEEKNIDFDIPKRNPLNVQIFVLTLVDNSPDLIRISVGSNIEHNQIGTCKGIANYDATTYPGFSGAPVVTRIDTESSTHYALLYVHTIGPSFAGRDCSLNGGVILNRFLDFMKEEDLK